MIHYLTARFRLLVVYRLPPSLLNKWSVTLSLEEFGTFFETWLALLLVSGDFNFHLDVPTDCTEAHFTDLLETFNLVQHVKACTHKNGHTLDLAITRNNKRLGISGCPIHQYLIILQYTAGCALGNLILKDMKLPTGKCTKLIGIVLLRIFGNRH